MSGNENRLPVSTKAQAAVSAKWKSKSSSKSKVDIQRCTVVQRKHLWPSPSQGACPIMRWWRTKAKIHRCTEIEVFLRQGPRLEPQQGLLAQVHLWLNKMSMKFLAISITAQHGKQQLERACTSDRGRPEPHWGQKTQAQDPHRRCRTRPS